MGFDIRMPIGYLFTIFGAMLVLFGLFTANADMYQRSLGINIDLWWGAVLLIFGLLMAFAARKSQLRFQQAGKAGPSQRQPPSNKGNS
jgi:multisubunit Na+/H+ antiporter MnhG subunit